MPRRQLRACYGQATSTVILVRPEFNPWSASPLPREVGGALSALKATSAPTMPDLVNVSWLHGQVSALPREIRRTGGALARPPAHAVRGRYPWVPYRPTVPARWSAHRPRPVMPSPETTELPSVRGGWHRGRSLAPTTLSLAHRARSSAGNPLSTGAAKPPSALRGRRHVWHAQQVVTPSRARPKGV